jgi:hypothetical protein
MYVSRYIECMWFGALGANIVSLRGVLNHPNLKLICLTCPEKYICETCKTCKENLHCNKRHLPNVENYKCNEYMRSTKPHVSTDYIDTQNSDCSGYWCNRYTLWHFGRPIIGLVAGLMAAIILSILALRSLVEYPYWHIYSPRVDPTRLAINYLVAFVLGMQENRFLDFLFMISDFFLRKKIKEHPQVTTDEQKLVVTGSITLVQDNHDKTTQ